MSELSCSKWGLGRDYNVTVWYDYVEFLVGVAAERVHSFVLLTRVLSPHRRCFFKKHGQWLQDLWGDVQVQKRHHLKPVEGFSNTAQIYIFYNLKVLRSMHTRVPCISSLRLAIQVVYNYFSEHKYYLITAALKTSPDGRGTTLFNKSHTTAFNLESYRREFIVRQPISTTEHRS
jgi:hypothetical protein